MLDADIAKWMRPRFQSLVTRIDATEWMYPTPPSFLPVHGANSSLPSCDLPAYARESSQAWKDHALNVQPGSFDPLADLSAESLADRPEATPSDAEIELEMSFVERTGQSQYGLATGQLARDVSLLGV
jgi:hypothetical protein